MPSRVQPIGSSMEDLEDEVGGCRLFALGGPRTCVAFGSDLGLLAGPFQEQPKAATEMPGEKMRKAAAACPAEDLVPAAGTTLRAVAEVRVVASTMPAKTSEQFNFESGSKLRPCMRQKGGHARSLRLGHTVVAFPAVQTMLEPIWSLPAFCSWQGDLSRICEGRV